MNLFPFNKKMGNEVWCKIKRKLVLYLLWEVFLQFSQIKTQKKSLNKKCVFYKCMCVLIVALLKVHFKCLWQNLGQRMLLNI